MEEDEGVAEASNAQDIVWHYTTGKGLLGILESNSIWASNINLLNDATENIRAKQLIRDNVRKRIKLTGKTAKADYEAIINMMGKDVALKLALPQKEYKKRLRELLSQSVWSQFENNIFVACFSQRKDSLSQWRAYTTVGGSYAVGFKKSSLMKLHANPAGKQGKDFVRRQFRGVEYYSKKKHDDVFDSFAQTLILQWLLDDTEPEFWMSILIGDTAPFFKDQAFAEEREWRLVCSVNLDYSGLALRVGRSHLIPYIEVKLPEGLSSIQEIKVGPGPSVKLDILALESFRDAKHLSFGVTKSRIPFRNW
jgi:hypothetical protein